jgi:gamma-glutamyltranspeptidase/glutathione hydrolase
LAACACACAAVSFIGVDAAPPLRPEFTGSRAVVATGRSFTVDTGARLIDEGGNAIDAGVASIFAAAVVNLAFRPRRQDPIIIASARDRKVVVINGQGPAPKDAIPALFTGQPAPPGNGPLGATVPAVVDAAALALSQYGTKSLADVMAPAIALADGFPMYEFLSHYLEIERENCLPYPATMATYYPDGRVTPAGEIFRQPNRTLRRSSPPEGAAGRSRVDAIRAGRDAFYTGDIARRIAAANRDAGGVMTEADLASYRGRIEEPQTTRYRGYDVYKAGPWNQSPVLLQTLNLLEGFDLATMGPQSADALTSSPIDQARLRRPRSVLATRLRRCAVAGCSRGPLTRRGSSTS